MNSPKEKQNAELFCPDCKGSLVEIGGSNRCQMCSRLWPIVDGIPSFVLDAGHERSFYEAWHTEEALKRRNGFFRQTVRQIVKPLRYFATKRERLFRRTFRKREKGPILDMACGIGQSLYCNFGPVTGVDLSLEALRPLQNSGLYKQVMHADARILPLLDGSFKYVVSADFLGHVPKSGKDEVIAEMSRVLAPGGIMAHVIETDSENLFFRFAHRYPQLFQKYFVEQIGGHYGLEMPTQVLRRFQNHGFKILQVDKMWGPIWATREYVRQFGNEYVTYNHILRMWVAVCRLLSCNPAPMIIADALLGMASKTVDRFQPLDYAQGIFLVAQKIR